MIFRLIIKKVFNSKWDWYGAILLINVFLFPARSKILMKFIGDKVFIWRTWNPWARSE
jgi:hypothetical protein